MAEVFQLVKDKDCIDCFNTNTRKVCSDVDGNAWCCDDTEEDPKCKCTKSMGEIWAC